MVKYVFITFIAIAALQGAFAKPKGKAAPEKTALEELSTNVQNLVNNVTQTLGIKELPDSKKIAAVVSENANVLAARLNELVEKVKSETNAHKPEVDSILKSVETTLKETATSLQTAAGPEATAKAQEIKTNLDNALKTSVAQANKLVKAIEPDATKVKSDIQNATKTLLEQIVEISNNLQNQVKASVEEHEKTHKH